MTQHQEISESEKVAMLLGGHKPTAHPSTTFTATCRLRPNEYAMLKAMSDRSGVARSALMTDLIKAGIESVLSDCPPDIAEELDHRVDAILESLDQEPAQ